MYWEIFAIIVNGEVVNTLVFPHGTGWTVANVIANESYGEDAQAVMVNQYPVAIGDTYTDGKFYRNGVEIERIPTENEKIEVLENQVHSLDNAVDMITVALLEG